MKIACVYDSIYPYTKGGAEKSWWEISTRLAARGHEVHLFGNKFWEGDDIITEDGRYLHGVCRPLPYFVDGRRSIKEAMFFGYKLLLPLLRGDYDIIHCGEFPYFSCFSAKFCSLFRRKPLAITWYEVWDRYWYEYLGSTKGFAGRVVERMTTKLPHTIIALSDRIKSDLIKIGVNEESVVVVPNGVDFERIQQIKPSLKNYDVIYVGRLVEHKNVDVLLKAIGMVKEEFPQVRCGIIGGGPEMGRLTELTKDLGLGGNVEFLGFVEGSDEVISHFKSSRVFVLPSIREGFPNTILEANASGLPVVIIDHKNNAGTAVVSNGVNGFITDLSEEAVASKIKLILQDPTLRMKLSQNSIESARDYDWKVIVSKLEEVYTTLVRKG